MPEAGPARTQGNTGYPGPASPQLQPAVGSGGGFLRGALQTAAGVAGRALLFEGISSLFHQGGMPWGLGGSGFLPSGTGPTLIERKRSSTSMVSRSTHSVRVQHLARIDQGAIEQAGYAPDADPSGVENSPADDDFVGDADLPDDLDQA